MNDRDVLGVLHDALDRVGHIEHKAGRELALWLAGVDEARRVWDELAGEHDRGHLVVKQLLLERLGLGLRDVADDAADDISPGFERLAVFVFERVAFADDLLGVEPERSDLASPCGPAPLPTPFFSRKLLIADSKTVLIIGHPLRRTCKDTMPDLILF